ncbi:short-chain dehydrogenase [bacterium]|nr:MAG: short-chain dehydrogenase [bacterium]
MSKRVALITGGGTGIGRATAHELAARGYSVVVCGRREELLAAAIENLGQSGLAIAGDLAEPDTARRVVEGTVDHFGRLDLLVNNAALYAGSPVLQCDADGEGSWQHHFELNLHAPWRVCRLAHPHLKASGSGVVINVLSTLAHKAMAGVSAYCASKAALEMLGRCLALEWAEDSIRVNSVSPGVVDTPIHEPGAAQAMAPAHPLGRIGQPGEVARAIVFLASDESGWTTGANLDVDGGIRIA